MPPAMKPTAIMTFANDLHASGRMAFLRPTAAERLHGRFMRAPDHDSGTGDGTPAPAPSPSPAPTGDPTPAPAAAEQQAAPDPAASEVATPAADPETSILGGDIKDAPAADGEKRPAVEPRAGAPEKYELALEGVQLDADVVGQAEPIMRELNMSNDEANRFLPVAKSLVEKTADSTMQSIIDAGGAQRKAWADAFKADPEIGGAKEQETVQLAAKGLDHLGFGEGHAFRQALTETGFGNHPDMIRAFRKIGEMVSEDGFARAGSEPANTLPVEKRLYPND